MSIRRVDGILVACFAAVVAAFVGATVYSQLRTGEIEAAALSIQGDAAPSIRHLANARAELRRLQLLVHRALSEGAADRTVEIESGRALLNAEVEAYRHLPPYEGEAASWGRAESALARLDGDVTGVLESLRGGDASAARVAQNRLDDDSEEVWRALSSSIDVNVAAATGLAQGIGASRRRGTVWAIELDAMGVVLAILAAALALRISHAHAETLEALQHSAEELQRAAERRAAELDAFATRMAHDIRNPLSAARLAFAEIMRTVTVDQKPGRAAARGERAIGHASEVIEALLNFARAGARAFSGGTASPALVAEEVTSILHTRAAEVDAELQVMSGSPAYVGCSAGMLASVIGNLVGNALTYVEGAPVRRVAVAIEDQGPDIRVTVSDTGPGLPSGIEKATLFEPYVRGPEARGRGLGLGLATVSRIIEAHHGKVGVDSASSGCRFWFTLPRAAERRVDLGSNGPPV